jgi:glycosyltransferase involved in cell wall biosynthesis
MPTRHLVVSAVNIVDGGTLQILRQCLEAAASLDGWHVTALVNDPGRIGVNGVHYLARPDIKPSWLKRIRFEYVECRTLAEALRPDFWLSLHDMTPNLGRLTGKVRQAVYCHNAMCFYRMSLREILLDPVLVLFSTFYPLFYRINLNRNSAVIVQQDWIRREFEVRFSCRHVVVAHPVPHGASRMPRLRSGHRFFYPSYARVFKNFELVLAAWEILCQDPLWDGELTLTIDARVNRYGAGLVRRFGHLRNVWFIGRVSHDEVQALYEQHDCLVFPSRLETWGMPLTEAKQAGLWILAADLPYAREALGSYGGVELFPAAEPELLAVLMRRFREGASVGTPLPQTPIAKPFAESWSDLFPLLLGAPIGAAVPPKSARPALADQD